MKASLKFRDDQKPLARAKIPISVLGFPFTSGVSAGDARDLRLDLATAFDSGPSLRVSYRPNDPWRPFSLVVKTGIGALGSPASAPMAMSAEFNLVGRGGPSFTIQLKPRLGDFCLLKTAYSAPGPSPGFLLGRAGAADHDTDGEGSVDGGDSPAVAFPGKKPNGISTGIPAATAGGIRRLLSGVELTARSVLPLRHRTAVKFRWGVRIPPELRPGFVGDFGAKDPITAISPRKLPLLVMSKISIEHAAGEPEPKRHDEVDGVAVACSSLQQQLAALQAENGMLRKAVEELRADLGGRKPEPVTAGGVTAKGGPLPEARDRTKAWEGARNGAKAAAAPSKSSAKASEAGGKVTKEDVNEELKKALMGATGAAM
uniref:CCAAT/enhancer-binding protein delta n=1 Tax=Anthurium amnicola TaxID=1678845 RepID=A0A1D1ZAI0_9ARAE